ncbi:hypothetical protein [Brevundimonas vesicularis]|uniref:hypothetical protein n=1 Tax=Brevundimonas vesicularis TaxID=41276 RepID=UPI00384DDBCE
MKIAILLPERPDLGWRWRAKELARSLRQTGAPDGSEITVAIGLPRESEADWRRKEAEMLTGDDGIVVRHLGWERVEPAMAERMFPDLKASLDDIPDVALPRDWGWNFVDCDAWIICADAAQGAVAPLKPVAYYVRDLAQRYVPTAFASGLDHIFWRRQDHAFRLWRQADCVFSSQAATNDDISGYAGVRRDRIVLSPQLKLDFRDASKHSSGAPIDLLWVAEPYAGHDPAVALEAIRILRSEGEDAQITVCGEQAYGFDPEDGQLTLSATPARARRAAESIACETVSDERELARVLSRAKIVWSSALADGEPEGVLRAAQVGVPFVGLRYPQAERLVEALGVKAFFYDHSEAGLIADALKLALSSEHSAPRSSSSPKDEADDWSSVVERLWRRSGE